MRKITLLCALFCVFAMSAQVTGEGTPLSWEVANRSAVAPVLMPAIDLAAVMAEDAVNDMDKSTPWRYGIELGVDLGISNAGVWQELPNGDGIWRINIVSEGAKTINFVFDQYKMPAGGSVYIYSDDRSSVIGAYTNIMNNDEQLLGTWMVDGQSVWVEYHEPKAVRGEGLLNINKVIHGYRSKTETDLVAKGLNDSGNCNHDVDCSVGGDWDPFKEDLKKSVALMIFDGFVCSGALINNTNNDRAPYFLTANHCDSGGSPATWAFRFNWRSPSPSCGTTTPSTTSAFNTSSGATLLARNAQSDFRLLNINGSLPDSWDLVWAGWNRSSTAIPDYTVGIHHPSGDIMKVCRDDESPFKGTIGGAQVWVISGTSWGGGDGWDIGVTEGGSSGSPLFNEDGHIVGQLFGGLAACAGTNDNSQYDHYGRFDQSWDTGTSASNSLQPWLDPSGTAGDTLETLSVSDFQFEANLSIFPNPASTILNVVNFGGTDLDYEVYSMLGQVIKRGTFNAVNNELNVADYTEGIYFVKIIDNENNASITKKIVVRH